DLEKGVAAFTIDTPPRVLTDLGYSYLITPKTDPELFKGIRGVVKKGQLQQTVVDQSIKYDEEANNGGTSALPSLDKDGPVRLSIFVNGQAAPIVNGSIPEPKETDSLVFQLENVTDAVHGVVLKVNGENTIYHEKFDCKDCYKWILKPGEKIR